jgi:hypothetical protein
MRHNLALQQHLGSYEVRREFKMPVQNQDKTFNEPTDI